MRITDRVRDPSDTGPGAEQTPWRARSIDVSRAWAIVLAACSGAPTRVPAKPTPQAVRAAVPAVQPTIRSAHGGEIRQLAATEDGTAALTADDHGKVRLWPTLDGTAEPVVVPTVSPQALALARDRDGFVLAALDAVGTVELVQLSPTGAVRGHVQLGGDAPVQHVVATSAGLLAVSADGVIELYDPTGRRLAHLVTESQERIEAIVYRSGRALALVDSPTASLHGRWVELDGIVRWGGETPALAIDPGSAALSPDHLRIAATTPDRDGLHHAVAIELATGAPTMVGGGVGRIVGFMGDKLAVALETTVEWFDRTGTLIADDEVVVPLLAAQGDLVSAVGLEVACDGRLVGAMDAQLALIAPSSSAFLGYRLRGATELAVTPVGLAVGLVVPSTLLGADYRMRGELHLPEPPSSANGSPTHWLDALQIDDHHAIAIAIENADATHRWTVVVDLTTTIVLQYLPPDSEDLRIVYDPTNRLLASELPGGVSFARFDPHTGKFGEPMMFPCDVGTEVGWLDPGRAGGNVAIVRCGFETAEIHGDDLHPGIVHARKRTRLAGGYLANDRAGRIYTQGDTAIVQALDHELDGQTTAVRTLRPSPDGSVLAAFTASRVTLLDVTGRARWTIALPNTLDVRWTERGELVAIAGGLVRLDLADGHFVDRQCGWGFELSKNPLDESPLTDPICDAL
jgi:hypothetical protein